MFVVVFCDVGEKRVAKALKQCRKYLNWVQKILLLKVGYPKAIKMELEKIIVPEEDFVILYIKEYPLFRTGDYGIA